MGSLLLSLALLAIQEADLRPNVLIVVMDDVAERDIDSIQTPAFDALASRGLRFRRAYAAPTCSPARRQLTFGTYATRDSGEPCKGGFNSASPPVGSLSLPKLFEGADYQTILVGKWHLGGAPWIGVGAPWELSAQAHGYEFWRAGLAANVNSECISGRGTYERWLRVDDGVSSVTTDYNTWAIRDAFLAWLQTAEAAPGPWFAMVCFQAPHGPFHVPPGMDSGPPGMGGGQRPRDRVKYELMLESFDESLGDILDAVDLSKTVVAVVGDNGTPSAAVGPAQSASKVKGTTYEDGIRVPMVWAGPGIARGETHRLVSLVDVLPTLAEMLRTRISPAAAALDGASLASLLANREAVVHEYIFAGLGNSSSVPGTDYAVVTQRWKYREKDSAPFLFDLTADPNETQNLAGTPDLEGVEAHLEFLLRRHVP